MSAVGKPRVVLVCGGRNYFDKQRIYAELDRIFYETGFSMLVHGDANGADLVADTWASQRGVDRTKYPANWKKHGKAGGPIRNARMLIHARPELVVAFPGGTGTAHMVRIAIEAGVETLVINP